MHSPANTRGAQRTLLAAAMMVAVACAGSEKAQDGIGSPASAAQDPWGELLPRHGEYSRTYRDADWATLGTGRELAKHDAKSYEWTSVVGDRIRQRIDCRATGQQLVEIKDLAYRVDWDDMPANQSSTGLWYIRDCPRVVIENVAFELLKNGWTPYVFYIHNCNEVYIGDAYFAGSWRNRAIRIN